MGSDYCCRCGTDNPPPPDPVPCPLSSTGRISKCLRVTFRGLSNPPFHEPGACGDCHCLNGRTFRIASAGPWTCTWSGSFSNACTCANGQIFVSITSREVEGEFRYFLRAQTYFGGVAQPTYEKDLGTDKPNGEALYNQELALVDYTDGKCQFADSSLLVSSSIFDCDHYPRLPPVGSAVCANCGSTFPSTIFVRLSNLSRPRSYCLFFCNQSQCDAMAGTYALTRRLSLPCWGDPSGPTSCVWGYDFPSHYCEWAGLTAQICTLGSGAGKAHFVMVNLRTEWYYGAILVAELGKGHPSCASFYAAGDIGGEEPFSGCCLTQFAPDGSPDRSRVEVWW